MQNISKPIKRALDFWKSKIKEKDFVVYGSDFPDEYVRKILQKEDLLFRVKKGLYLLKNKGNEAEDAVYRLYWFIVEKILKVYAPWSIEKETAMALYLGNESVPQKLMVRIPRKIKHHFLLPSGLKIQIRPDPTFNEKTSQSLDVGRAKIYLDVPERVLFSVKKRTGLDFRAFIKSMKFDRRMLEVLYSSNPKPIIVKDLIGLANKCERADLSSVLKDILRKYSIYRF